MNGNVYKAIAAVGLVLLLAGVGVLRMTGDPAPAPRTQKENGRKVKLRRARAQAPTSARQAVRDALQRPVPTTPRKRVRHDPDGMYGRLKGEDRRLAENVQKALDDGVFADVVAAAERALNSRNPEVQENAIEALGWFGIDALPELTAYMAHENEEVAQAAMHQWDQALAEVPECAKRLSISAAALSTLSNEEVLDSIAGQFSNAALEYIDGEEDETKASEKRVEVVQMLLDLIEGENEVRAEKAREAYEDITGSGWHGVEEAEKYLGDPDNYEEPDDK